MYTVNVAVLMTNTARVHGDRIGLVYDGQHSTYSEMEDRISRLAAGLIGTGLSAGARIVIWMRNRPELVELLFAGLKAGLVVVPVNPRLHQLEVAYILGDCRAEACFIDETFEFEELKRIGTKTFQATQLPYATSRLPQSAEVAPEDLAWLFYTSGTTGRSKGAMLTHKSLLSMTMNCLADIYSFEPEDVVLHAAPLTHGSGLYLLPSVARGSKNVIAQGGFDSRAIFETIERERVTAIAFLAPTQIARLISDGELKSHDLSSLRCVIYGGGPMYVEHIKKALALMGKIWVQIYGQGETPMTGTFLRASDHRTDTPVWERRLGSVGIPRTDVELSIVRPDGTESANGEIGEIVIRGNTVMTGYWNNPQATSEALHNGWLHTGDLGYCDDDGYIYIVDRAKDMIISGGNNIYAREVEEALLNHPKVLEVAVFGIPDAYWGETVHAAVALREGETMEPEEVIDHCRSMLASYKKPKTVEFVAELPKNAYGKVVKRELRDKWVSHDRAMGGGHSTAGQRTAADDRVER